MPPARDKLKPRAKKLLEKRARRNEKLLQEFVATIAPIMIGKRATKKFFGSIDITKGADLSRADKVFVQRLIEGLATFICEDLGRGTNKEAREAFWEALMVLSPPKDLGWRRKVKTGRRRREKERWLERLEPEMLVLYEVLLPAVQKVKSSFKKSYGAFGVQPTAKVISRWLDDNPDAAALNIVPPCKLTPESIRMLFVGGEEAEPSYWLEERLARVARVSHRVFKTLLKNAREHREQP